MEAAGGWRVGRLIMAVCVAALVFAVGAPGAEQPGASDDAAPQRTLDEVNALMDEAGKVPPDWVSDMQLSYPNTLDLTWHKIAEGWQPNKNLGTYVFITAGRNEQGLRRAVKLLYKVIEVNQDNTVNLRKSRVALADFYFHLEEYAQALYWYRQARVRTVDEALHLVRCYYKLGCKEAAVGVLNRIPSDNTRNGHVILAWGEVGELGKALLLAVEKARGTYVDAAYLAAGGACRHSGRYLQAIQYYNKVLALSSGGRDLNKSKERARYAVAALTAYEEVDLAEIPDGRYEGQSRGFRGDVRVAVSVKDGRITSVQITNHREDRMLGGEVFTPRHIVSAQGIAGVDAVTGASITSDAIINAVAKALGSAATK